MLKALAFMVAGVGCVLYGLRQWRYRDAPPAGEPGAGSELGRMWFFTLGGPIEIGLGVIAFIVGLVVMITDLV